MEAGNHAIRWYQTFPIGDRNVMETDGCTADQLTVAVDLQLFQNNVSFGVKMVYEDLISYLNGL